MIAVSVRQSVCLLRGSTHATSLCNGRTDQDPVRVNNLGAQETLRYPQQRGEGELR